MRFFNSSFLIALFLAIGLVSCTSDEERVDAREAFLAVCTGGANTISTRANALCLEVRDKLQSSLSSPPWPLITEIGKIAADTCLTQQNSSICQIIERQTEQLSVAAFARAFPQKKRVDLAEAVILFQNVCESEQSEVGAQSLQECRSLSKMISEAQKPNLSQEESKDVLSTFTLSILQAARSITDTCWPRGAAYPVRDGGCRSVRWTWIGNEKSRCHPDLTTLQNHALPEGRQIEMALRYIRQPSLCFWNN